MNAPLRTPSPADIESRSASRVAPPAVDARALATRLRRELRGEVSAEPFERGRHATDASIYQVMPLAVARPRDAGDVRTCLAVAGELGVPVTGRGGGTSQCGQTVNRGLVVDCSRHMNALLELDVEARRCRVQPGIVLDELNRALKPHGLWFPVDISTASRATIGGMTANNSCGQRSLRYGTMRHNVHAIEAILANGDGWRFGATSASLGDAPAAARALYADLLAIGRREAAEITARFPDVLRRVGGYNIDALVPPELIPSAGKDSPSWRADFAVPSVDRDARGDARHNFAHLLVGSEGTLAFSSDVELALAPLPVDKVLGVCHFPTFRQAMAASRHLVALGPHSVELVDATMIDLARDIPLYRSSIEAFVRGEPAALLLVEFEHDTRAANLAALGRLRQCMADELGLDWRGEGERWGGVVEATDARLRGAIGEVRKAGLNIMMSMKSEGKPVSFVEDCAVGLDDLADFTEGLTEVFERHGTTGTWYAHASVGCLHVRPVLNVKLEKDAETMRAIAEEAFALVAKYKGSHSGEHGDGIARSEFHERMFGARMVRTFAEVKRRFDPDGLMNPGRIVDPPRMNERILFRYPPGYTMEGTRARLDWSDWPGAGGGLQGAVEMCNNNGTCRKLAGGVMCPSYRVTREERDSTRGRANSLRLALSGQLGTGALVGDEMRETMKLCVSCKGCRRECPTGVDMAKMKIEVLAARAATHGHSLHERLIAHLPRYAPLLSRAPWLANLRNALPVLARLAERPSGFAAGRPLPRWRSDAFRERDSVGKGERETVLFADTFDVWFEPENLRAARRVLSAAGYRVHVAQAPGERNLCCGRTYLATGMVERAREEARRTIAALLPWARRGVPIVGLEPSCLLTLRDEFLSLLPGEEAEAVAGQALMLEELLARDAEAGRLDGQPGWHLGSPAPRLLVHGHCHQKAFGVMGSLQRTLALIPDTAVESVESGCCGMAGAFGYGRDTRGISARMAELDLLPAVRSAADDTLLVAGGTSCRHQIADLGGREARHVVRVLEAALEAGPGRAESGR